MKNFNTLNILTKSEIIEFLNQKYFYSAPTKEEVNFWKWDRTARILQKKMDEHIKRNKDSTLGKDIDALSKQFNNETDIDKKLKILEAREALLEQWRTENKEWDEITKQMDINDKLIERKT